MEATHAVVASFAECSNSRPIRALISELLPALTVAITSTLKRGAAFFAVDGTT